MDVAHDGEEALERYGQAMKEAQVRCRSWTDHPRRRECKETIGQLLRMDPGPGHRLVRVLQRSRYGDYEDFGFVGVVPKPYKIEELSLVVKNAMLLGPSDNPEPDRFK